MSHYNASMAAYESGQMSLTEKVELFSDLLQTGLLWSLDDQYQSEAQQLMDRGYLNGDGDILNYGDDD